MQLRLLLLLCPLSLAWNIFSSPEKQAQPQTETVTIFPGEPPACYSKREQFEKNTFRCPEPSELIKDGLKWRTQKGWKGYQDSLATEISKFLGAQWKGVGLGRIICIYAAADSRDFPIQISSERLVQRPTLPRWEDNPKSNLINCISINGSTCECPFSYYIAEEEQDLDTIIKNLKQ
ncbi:T4SS-associated protein EirA [Gammaproteobacteria bacterium]|nr:T4SS-associated protein EirA [Gammaproteobacteria bacterium]